MLMMMLSTTIMGKEQPANHALTVVAATKDYGSSIPHQTHTRKTDDGGKEDGTKQGAPTTRRGRGARRANGTNGTTGGGGRAGRTHNCEGEENGTNERGSEENGTNVRGRGGERNEREGGGGRNKRP